MGLGSLHIVNTGFISHLDVRSCLSSFEKLVMNPGALPPGLQEIGRGEFFVSYRAQFAGKFPVVLKIADQRLLGARGPKWLKAWKELMTNGYKDGIPLFPAQKILLHDESLCVVMPLGTPISWGDVMKNDKLLDSVDSMREKLDGKGWHNTDTHQLAKIDDTYMCYDFSDLMRF